MDYQYEYHIYEDTQTADQVKKPPMYHVIMHNDDYTTMDFVVHILMMIFSKNSTDAFQIMMEVHRKGQSVVGTYTFDIALTKKMQATKLAEENDFPLKITVEEEMK